MHDGPLQSGNRRGESAVEKADQRFVRPLAAHDRDGDPAGSCKKELVAGTNPESLAGFLLNSWQGALLRSQAEKSNAPLETFMHYMFDELLTKKSKV